MGEPLAFNRISCIVRYPHPCSASFDRCPHPGSASFDRCPHLDVAYHTSIVHHASVAYRTSIAYDTSTAYHTSIACHKSIYRSIDVLTHAMLHLIGVRTYVWHIIHRSYLIHRLHIIYRLRSRRSRRSNPTYLVILAHQLSREKSFAGKVSDIKTCRFCQF